jgi:hypothetical protein
MGKSEGVGPKCTHGPGKPFRTAIAWLVRVGGDVGGLAAVKANHLESDLAGQPPVIHDVWERAAPQRISVVQMGVRVSIRHERTRR